MEKKNRICSFIAYIICYLGILCFAAMAVGTVGLIASGADVWFYLGGTGFVVAFVLGLLCEVLSCTTFWLKAGVPEAYE